MQKMTIDHKIETIDPETAKQYLKKNDSNRKIRKKQVQYLARQMKNNEWSLNGQGITFSSTGRLLNGQHRLLACIEAGVPFQTLVVRGVANEAFAKIDTGAPRSAADVLRSHDFHKATIAGAAIRLLIHMEKLDAGLPNNGWNDKTEPHKVLAYAKRHRRLLDESLGILDTETKAVFKPQSIFVALYLFLHRRNASKCKQFFEALAYGEKLSKRDPVYKLRQLLINQDPKKQRRNNQWRSAITIKAWNAWMNGESVEHLMWSSKSKWPLPVRRRGGKIEEVDVEPPKTKKTKSVAQGSHPRNGFKVTTRDAILSVLGGTSKPITTAVLRARVTRAMGGEVSTASFYKVVKELRVAKLIKHPTPKTYAQVG